MALIGLASELDNVGKMMDGWNEFGFDSLFIILFIYPFALFFSMWIV